MKYTVIGQQEPAEKNGTEGYFHADADDGKEISRGISQQLNIANNVAVECLSGCF